MTTQERTIPHRTRTKTKKKSQLKMVWQSFRKNKLAMFGLFLLLGMMCVALGADLFFDYEKDALQQNIRARLQGPSAKHLLGTDQVGRDLLARIIYGGRISLFSGVLIVLMSLVIGSVIGSAAGYYG